MINNIAYYLEGLSTASSTKLMQLFNSMSSPSFLLVNDTNHSLLRSLLESVNSILEHKYSSEWHQTASEFDGKIIDNQQKTRNLLPPYYVTGNVSKPFGILPWRVVKRRSKRGIDERRTLRLRSIWTLQEARLRA